jgi:tetratricopeptide (TPR) repeat protein
MEEILKHKATGTEFFKQGKYEEAVGAYSEGLKLCGGDFVEEQFLSTSVILLSNRSLCLCKLGRAEEALKDANEATDIDPKFAKGWIRRATAFQALGRLKDALASYDEAIALAPEVKSFQKARKAVKDTVKQVEKQREQVGAFAQNLVVEAIKVQGVDPNGCSFAKDGETLNIAFKDKGKGDVRSMHVPTLYARFSQLTSEDAKAKFLVNAVKTYVAADPSESKLPDSFEEALSLLHVQLVNKERLKRLDNVAFSAIENVRSASRCVGECSDIEKHLNDLAVVTVCDRGHARFFVTTAALEQWGKSFNDVFAAAAKNMKQQAGVKEWKSHPSACATSPWNDGFDAARIAAFPSFVEAAKTKGGADEGDRVVLFGATNCSLVAGSRNPIGLCFAGDIVVNDIAKSGDLLSKTPYRLARVSATEFAWTAYAPSAGEFSVPAEQSEIDAILEAVQGGRAIPVFGTSPAPKKKAAPQEGKKSMEKKAKLTWAERVFQTLHRSVNPDVRPPAKKVIGRLLEISTGWQAENKTSPNGQVLPGWIPADEIKDTPQARLAALRLYCQIRDKACIDLDRKASEVGGFCRSEFAERVPRYRRPILKVIADFGGERTLTVLSLAQKMTAQEAFSAPIAKRNLVQLVHNIMHIKEMQHAAAAVEEVLSADPAFRALLPDVFGDGSSKKAADESKEEGSKSDYSPPKPKASFVPSDTFSGAKDGYVFKSGPDGIGYYIDITKSTTSANVSKTKAKKMKPKTGLEKNFKQGFLKSKPGNKKAPVAVAPAETTSFTVGGQTFTMNADMDFASSAMNDMTLGGVAPFNPNAPLRYEPKDSIFRF